MNKTFTTSKLFVLLAATLISQGCSTPRTLLNHDHTVRSVLELQSWRTEGKMAIIQEHHNLSTNFKWHQQKHHITLNLTNSLGFGTATLTSDNNTFKLVTSDGQRIETADGEELLANKLGVKIPLKSLYFWLRGLPDPNLKITKQRRDENNLLTNLSQEGWQLEYASYKPYDRIYLPCKIYLVTPKIRIKIFIINWYQ